MQTILTGGRGRRRALTLALSTAVLAIALMGVSAGSASAATCPAGAAAVTVQSYTLTGPNGVARPATNLNGNVHSGDTVLANFTVNVACTAGVVVNFPSYLAPGSSWDPSTANRQQLFDPGTGGQSFAPGANTITTTAPAGGLCFQVDLVRDAIIQTFDPANGVTYSAQHRLIAFGNGDPGCTPAV